MQVSLRHWSVSSVFISGAILIAGCAGEKGDPTPLVFDHTVRGRVTFEGKTVPYGYVIFYHLEKSIDPNTGTVIPAAHAKIQNGRYEVTNVPNGPMSVCVACDPDLSEHALLKARPMEPPKTPQLTKGPETGLPEDPALIPPGMEAPGTPGHSNPEWDRLTSEQKRMLKRLHAKYGQFETGLTYSVDNKEQTFDLNLK